MLVLDKFNISFQMVHSCFGGLDHFESGRGSWHVSNSPLLLCDGNLLEGGIERVLNEVI